MPRSRAGSSWPGRHASDCRRTRISCAKQAIASRSNPKQRLLRVALNRLGENGAWSLEDLKVEFEELIVEQTPIEISGFSAPEMDQILLGDDPPPHELVPLPHGRGLI